MFNFGFGMFYLHIHQPREHHFDLHSSCIHFNRKLLFQSENKCNPIFIHSWRYKIFCSSSNCSCLPSISCSNRLSHSNIVSTTITDKFLVWLSIAVPSANFLTISPTILTLQTQSLWCGLSTDLFQFCGRPNCPTDFNERSKLCCEAQTCCLSFQTVYSKSAVYSASISYAHCTLYISCKHHVYFLFNTIKKLHKASATISTRVVLHDTSHLQMLRTNPLRV